VWDESARAGSGSFLCVRGSVIRIISVRRATPREVAKYEDKRNMKREYNFSKAKRGAVVPLLSEKVRITIWLDRYIVDHFRD
jgi:hypothetical protein